MSPTYRNRRIWLALALGLSLVGCKRHSGPPRPSPSASVALASARGPLPLVSQAIPPPRLRMPSGPRLAIVPGGVGPIRIGATRQTIERLMEAPCEEFKDDTCRYVARGVEFRLKDGQTDRIYVHQQERLAGGQDKDGRPRLFGIFNGFIPPGASFGMLPKAVHELIGPPKRVEQVPPGSGPYNVREVHYHDGMALEYDLYSNGNLILGGVRIPE